jgi:hypothetical protein
MVRCYIKERSFPARLAALFMGAPIAMVLGKTIHLYGATREDFLRDITWVRHEICHVMQYRELGSFTFLRKYIWEWIKVGYKDISFEVAARAAERDVTIMKDVVII